MSPTTSYIPVLGAALMVLATIGMGLWATRKAKTAADFFVAGRSVGVFWNASAISGEYLSAASFMGIAGLLMKNGYDALWYPACYAAGYLFLLLFIAGPLRRFGAYTIPDFAEGRFDSPAFRKVAVTFVLFIGFFYTMPQMKGAGVTLGAILDWPYWAGIAVVGVVITFNVAFGGMKGITLVQAFQYWAKMFAISAPIFVLATVYGHYWSNVRANLGDKSNTARSAEMRLPDTPNVDESLDAPYLKHPGGTPHVWRDATIKIKGKDKTPANILKFSPAGPSTIVFPDGADFGPVTVSKLREQNPTWTIPGPFPYEPNFKPGWHGVQIGVDNLFVPKGGTLEVFPWTVTRDGGMAIHGPESSELRIEKPVRAVLKSGSVAPNAPPDAAWVRPFGPMTSKHRYPMLYTYSLIVALICGTAGLPHILVRFYTNPDGRAAKRTTLWVMVMLGAFYVFTPIWGTMGRNAMPELYANSTTDSVVIRLPSLHPNPLVGQILGAITSAGAFAAFMSTFSGLLVSMSGALAHDIYGKILRPSATPADRMRMFKVAAVVIGIASMGLGLLVESFDIAMMVGWAFAIAACSYFPLLLLGAWWRGLTKYGAGCGMLGGGVASLAAIITSMLLDKKILTFEVSPLIRSLMEQPAIWGVPLSIGLMIVVSLLTARSIPPTVDLKMLRLHAPEEMGLSKNYIEH